MDFGWTDTWWPLGGFIVAFTVLHGIALRFETNFLRAFQLSRGAAAMVLTALGVAALFGGLEHWHEAFLYRQTADDWMRLGLLVVCGHLLSDFVWMAYGRLSLGIQPRRDLILHHALGVVGFGAALVLEMGYAFGLLAMLTELLPVTTGLNALGKRLENPSFVTGADRARLHVLFWFRLPFWGVMFAFLVHALVRGTDAGMRPAYLVAAVGMVVLIGLDLFWFRKCRQGVSFY